MPLRDALRGPTAVAVAGALLSAAYWLSGCAADTGSPAGPTATLRVTQNFGHELLAAHDDAAIQAPGTLLGLLRANHTVRAPNEGLYVETIDGRRQRTDVKHGSTLWVANVNGIETDRLPVEYELFDGDLVQWDLRPWHAERDVRATVGAFPETFTQGVFGRRLPVTVECEDRASPPCRHVKRLLAAVGVRTDGSLTRGTRPPPAGSPRRAQILVGPWAHWQERRWPAAIDRGPARSGVFARFSQDAATLHLLDWNARPVTTEAAGTGLIAAMRPTEDDLLWLVTGVDDEGVARAARAIDSESVRDAFAVAVTAEGVRKLPLEAG